MKHPSRVCVQPCPHTCEGWVADATRDGCSLTPLTRGGRPTQRAGDDDPLQARPAPGGTPSGPSGGTAPAPCGDRGSRPLGHQDLALARRRADRLPPVAVDDDHEPPGLRRGAVGGDVDHQLGRGVARGLELAQRPSARRPARSRPVVRGRAGAGAGARAGRRCRCRCRCRCRRRTVVGCCGSVAPSPKTWSSEAWTIVPRSEPSLQSVSTVALARLLAGVRLLAGALVLQRHQPYGGGLRCRARRTRACSASAPPGGAARSGTRRRARCRTASTWRSAEAQSAVHASRANWRSAVKREPESGSSWASGTSVGDAGAGVR